MKVHAVRVLSLCATLSAVADPVAAQVEPVRVRLEVVDVAGRPLEGVGMILGFEQDLRTDLALERPLARSDERGSITYVLPDPGRVEVPGVPRFVLLARRGYATAKIVVRAAGLVAAGLPAARGTVDMGRVVLVTGRPMTGVVRGEEGRPLPGVVIEARELGDGSYARSGSGAMLTSIGETDAKGRFVLAGVDTKGVSITCRAPGYYESVVPFADGRRPIDVTLETSGFIEGRVTDGRGGPARATLHPRYEGGTPAASHPTVDDGTFKISISHRGRYSVQAVGLTVPGEQYRSANSLVCSGPVDGLVIDLPVPGGENIQLSVRALAAETELPVPGARAAVLWQDPRFFDPVSLGQLFGANSVAPSEDGRIRLAGPRGTVSSGALLVKAVGMAPTLVEGLEFDPDEPELTVEMERESSVRGTVIDEATGEPIPGAQIAASPKGLPGGYALTFGINSKRNTDAETDAEGQFRLGELGPGEHELRASIAGRPASPWTRVRLVAGEESKDVRLMIPKGVSVTGRVFVGWGEDGEKRPSHLGSGWRVSLVPRPLGNAFGPMSFGYDLQLSVARVGTSWDQVDGVSSLDTEGRFRFDRVAAGRYSFALLAPGGGNAVTAFIEPVRVRGVDMDRDFDISDDMPGLITGKISTTDPAYSLGRLSVMSVPVNDNILQQAALQQMQVRYSQSYLRTMVEPDGSFSFRSPPGRHYVFITDNVTRLVVYRSAQAVDLGVGETVQQDIEIELAHVRVRLRPEVPDQGMVASWLTWKSVFPGEVDDEPRIGGGWPIQGEREFILSLPPVRTQFAVRSELRSVDPGGQHQNHPIGVAEITPVMGRLNTLEISVAPPSDLDASRLHKR